jgi:hypothetical protein
MCIKKKKKYRYSCQILRKLELSRQIFEKYSHTKFYVNPSNWIRVVPCRQTDRQTQRLVEAHSLFTKIYEPT